MSYGAQFRNPLLMERISVPFAIGSVVVIDTLMAGYAAGPPVVHPIKQGTTKLWLQNLSTDNMYWAFASSAPDALTKMAKVVPGDWVEWNWEGKQYESLYVCTDGTANGYAVIMQEGLA